MSTTFVFKEIPMYFNSMKPLQERLTAICGIFYPWHILSLCPSPSPEARSPCESRKWLSDTFLMQTRVLDGLHGGLLSPSPIVGAIRLDGGHPPCHRAVSSVGELEEKVCTSRQLFGFLFGQAEKLSRSAYFCWER